MLWGWKSSKLKTRIVITQSRKSPSPDFKWINLSLFLFFHFRQQYPKEYPKELKISFELKYIHN